MTEINRLDKITGDRVKSREPSYSDFLTNFNKHPDTGILSKNINENAVKRSIRNLILTNKGEALFNPNKGSDIRKLLFENMSDVTESLLKTYITDVIREFEPRCNLIDVIVVANYNNNLYNIAIVFQIINNNENITLTLQLDRIR